MNPLNPDSKNFILHLHTDAEEGVIFSTHDMHNTRKAESCIDMYCRASCTIVTSLSAAACFAGVHVQDSSTSHIFHGQCVVIQIIP